MFAKGVSQGDQKEKKSILCSSGHYNADLSMKQEKLLLNTFIEKNTWLTLGSHFRYAV